MKRAVDQDMVTQEMAGPLARCALGVLHFRLATLWPKVIDLMGALAAGP